ncbi:DUF4907 domain-containing protein [Hymenobacter monticola]|uniref:DUF4907 domain-containing protein n=1 Tax=Hymenobacter monticola TaxID=1705399 RepID=A0ABY4BCP9_9BACT|nr:DUF4907 domain-containing protein [Hymenobacter monticola]UOE36855.1 DUF4907 domain-containing protein [Hymenobacter monticola]
MTIRGCLRIIWLGAAAACTADPPPHQPPAAPSPASVRAQPAEFTAAVEPNADGSYGYVVKANGRPLILQPHVPGRPGTRGFATAAQAQQVAQLVESKLRRGQMPPSVTAAELDSLGL